MSAALPLTFAVLGDPVGHSKSPRMHQAAYVLLDVAARYLALQVKPADLTAALHGARALGFTGVNLTVPHKYAALAILDECSPRVQRIGAANTIAFVDGKIIGHNTDAPGFVAALEELAGPLPTRATVLGSGGAAAAVVDGLLEAYPTLMLQWISRDPAKLTIPTQWQDRVLALNYQAVAADRDGVPLGDLLVNATTVGMSGGGGEFPVPLALDRLHASAQVVDIVYPRPRGGLLDQAAARGLVTQDGLPMLLWQGVLALQLWLDRPIDPPVVQAMRDALYAG